MDVKAENTLTKQDINALIKCSAGKTGRILIILSVTFVMFLIFCMIVGSTGRNFSYCLAGLLWCALVYSYIFLVNPVIVYRSFCKKYGSDAIIVFKFKNDKMSVHIENSGGSLNCTKNLEDLFKAYETEDHFFLYTKRNETYIMRKSGITQGTPRELSEGLTRKMGNKFVRKVRSNAKI